MEYSFTFKGHRNITAKHPLTIEFTKDSGVTSRGNCIVGVAGNFDAGLLKKFIAELEGDAIIVEIAVDGSKEIVHGSVNRHFSDRREMVLRKSLFVSDRTFMMHADKASSELSRELVRKLQQGAQGRVVVRPGAL